MKSFVASTSMWLALTLMWSAACIDAVVIKASAVDAPTSDLGKFQTLDKTWNISGPSRLHNLLVQAPGLVFVDYDASPNTIRPHALGAKVVVTDDSETLLNDY